MLIALSEADREGLKALISKDFDRIVTMFSAIKSENAEATLEEDRVKIFGCIRSSLGTDAFK